MRRPVASGACTTHGWSITALLRLDACACGRGCRVSDKFIAFAGPHDARKVEDGYYTLVPEDYIPYFRQKRVALVIRLNKAFYDKQRFIGAGIQHADLYFDDGSTPSPMVLQRFLRMCEETPGVIAVHCKAGLGRTGTCIGCYLMKHYRWTAAEVGCGWRARSPRQCPPAPQCSPHSASTVPPPWCLHHAPHCLIAKRSVR